MNEHVNNTANTKPGCEQIQEELPSLLYGELPEEQRATVQTHLDACPECRREWDDLQKTAAQLDAWTPPNLLRQPSVQSERRRHGGWWVRSAAIGGLAAALVFGALVLFGADARWEDGRFVLAIGKPQVETQHATIHPEAMINQVKQSAEAEMDRRIGLLIEAIREEFNAFEKREARERVQLVRYVDMQREQFAAAVDSVLRSFMDDVVDDSLQQREAIQHLFAMINPENVDENQPEEYEQ